MHNVSITLTTSYSKGHQMLIRLTNSVQSYRTVIHVQAKNGKNTFCILYPTYEYMVKGQLLTLGTHRYETKISRHWLVDTQQKIAAKTLLRTIRKAMAPTGGVRMGVRSERQGRGQLFATKISRKRPSHLATYMSYMVSLLGPPGPKPAGAQVGRPLYYLLAPGH